MFRDKEVVAEAKELEKVKVEATVPSTCAATKIKVFKYKPKKGYRRRAGHRSELTKLEVTEIRLLTRKPAAAEKEEPAEKKTRLRKRRNRLRKSRLPKKPAAEKKAAEKPLKKPAAKKAAAKAKKPAAKTAAQETGC